MRTPLTALAAVCLLGCSDDATTGTSPKQVPPPPASVSAKIVNNNLELSWSEVAGATSYNVYMAAEAGVKRVNYASLTANMFHPGEAAGKFDHPPGLDANMKYFMVVTAVNADGESAESCEVGAVVATRVEETC